MTYRSSYVIVYKSLIGISNPVALIKITGRVGSTGGGRKSIPVGKSAYEIVMPSKPDMAMKKFIQTRLLQVAYKDEYFLDKKTTIRFVFKVDWDI